MPKEKNKKVIGLAKDELCGQVEKELVGLRVKAFSYLEDNNDEDKKVKNVRLKKKT